MRRARVSIGAHELARAGMPAAAITGRHLGSAGGRRVCNLLRASLLTLFVLAAIRPVAAEPRVPAGTDPGGIAVAIIASGLDYTRPEIAARLARDGEGEAIAWDFRDMDRAPYEPPAEGGKPGPGTASATAVLSALPAGRIVPLRPTGDPRALGATAHFVSKSPARVALVTIGSVDRQDWQVFAEISARHPELLFVVAAGDEGIDLDAVPRFPASLGLANVLVVSACDATTGKPLPGANTGARTVDVMVPARQATTAAAHDGRLVMATATAAAASRVVGLAASHSSAGVPSPAQLKEHLRKAAPPSTTPESLAASRLGCIQPPPSNKF